MISVTDNKPILIAGPTASGKSSLAINFAQRLNGAIINADALQVYEGWNVLTARPPEPDLAQCPHYMYGHVGMTQSYSVGEWLNEVQTHIKLCADQGLRPIIVGGTGLYFTALTEGLAEIPPVPDAIRNAANELANKNGKQIFAEILKKDDPDTYAKIDVLNPMRTQRAWEVLTATGKGLAHWQAVPLTPILTPANAHCFVMLSDTDWLNERIDRRFDIMMDTGALVEAQAAKDTFWDETLPSCKAIGAKELISHLDGQINLTQAIEAGKLNSRRYAKRQRTWFRSRMGNWNKIHLSDMKIDIDSIIQH